VWQELVNHQVGANTFTLSSLGLLPQLNHVVKISDNGRQFYEYIMNKSITNLDGLEFAVFGLGSTAGHAAYFNVIGKSLDKRLEELGASRVMEIGLGDDGDCIEDDFDNWADRFASLLRGNGEKDENGDVGVEEVFDDAASTMDVEQQREQIQLHEAKHEDSAASRELDEMKVVSKFPTIKLLPKSENHHGHKPKHLFHLNHTPNQFYADRTVSLNVIGNKLLGVEAGESGIHELKLAAPNVTYETGDHLVVYPQNSHCIVEAYLDMFDVDRHSIIAEDGQAKSYPFPKVCHKVFV
jgi:NADPH-ferrihemoprotein reductase